MLTASRIQSKDVSSVKMWLEMAVRMSLLSKYQSSAQNDVKSSSPKRIAIFVRADRFHDSLATDQILFLLLETSHRSTSSPRIFKMRTRSLTTKEDQLIENAPQQSQTFGMMAELILIVISYLPLSDVKKLQQVNKSFHQLSDSFFHTTKLGPFPPIYLDQQHSTLSGLQAPQNTSKSFKGEPEPHHVQSSIPLHLFS